MAKSIWKVSEFLGSLPTASTRNSYQTALKMFFSHIYDEVFPARGYVERLDELSLRYFTEDRDHDRDYVGFYNEVKGKYAPKTVELRALAVRGLFEFNGVAVSKAIQIRLNGRKAIEPISEEKIPRREEIRIILHHLPLHVKSLALVMLSGGLRPGEALGLRLNSFEEDGDLLRVNLKGRETKTGRRRWTYITPETREVLNLWLRSREQFRQSVAGSMLSPTSRERYLKRTEDLVYPFIYNATNKVWKTALKKSGLLEKDQDTNRVTLRLHNLRKYFSTRGKWTDKDIPDFFQGHLSGVRAVYSRYDQAEEVVRQAYREAIPSLTIEEYSDSGEVESLHERLNEQQLEATQLNRNVNYLLSENQRQSEEVGKLKEQLATQDTKFEQLQEQVKQFMRGFSPNSEDLENVPIDPTKILGHRSEGKQKPKP